MKSASRPSPMRLTMLTGRDLALVEPDPDLAIAFEFSGKLPDKGLVFARMAERDGDYGGARL